MKKSLFLILISCMSFCATRTVAQSIDSLQVVVDSLSIKVVKLEHDLAYLKVDTDIRTLDAKIEILTMRTENILTDFQLAILTNNKSEAKVLYRNLYQSYEEPLQGHQSPCVKEWLHLFLHPSLSHILLHYLSPYTQKYRTAYPVPEYGTVCSVPEQSASALHLQCHWHENLPAYRS